MEARSTRFRLRALLVPRFAKWRAATRHVVRLEQLARVYQDDQEAELLYGSLEKWHRNTSLALAQREVAARVRETLLKGAWAVWSQRTCVDQVGLIRRSSFPTGKVQPWPTNSTLTTYSRQSL
jgi:hypothetical protein